jgi:putative flippase GtrA
MTLRSVLWQWLRFVAVGVSNTLVSWCVYATLETVGVPYLLASALAFALGALNSYVLNRRWTFRSRGRRGPELLRFGIAQAIVFPVASAATFLLSRQWAFRPQPTGVSSAA